MMKSIIVQNPFGTINPPPGTPAGAPLDALVKILNVGLNLIMILAGFAALLNFLRAGYTYLMAGGDAKKVEEAQNRLKWSAVGLVLVVSAPLVAALVGLVVFHDPMAILKPEIKTIP